MQALHAFLLEPSMATKKLPVSTDQEKGVSAKGVSAESSVTAKRAESTQGCWTQQYIWHSECHSQERRTFLQKPPSKNLQFLAPEKFAELW